MHGDLSTYVCSRRNIHSTCRRQTGQDWTGSRAAASSLAHCCRPPRAATIDRSCCCCCCCGGHGWIGGRLAAACMPCCCRRPRQASSYCRRQTRSGASHACIHAPPLSDVFQTIRTCSACRLRYHPIPLGCLASLVATSPPPFNSDSSSS